MPNGEKKGITVQINIELHAEIRQYLEAHDMSMTEFVTLALEHELHPKIQMKEEKENMRTLAFQIPEDLFQKIKDYLRHNDMTQKAFVVGLIEAELEWDLAEREAMQKGVDEQQGISSVEGKDLGNLPKGTEKVSDEQENSLKELEETIDADDTGTISGEDEKTDGLESYEDREESEDAGQLEDNEDEGFSIGM